MAPHGIAWVSGELDCGRLAEFLGGAAPAEVGIVAHLERITKHPSTASINPQIHPCRESDTIQRELQNAGPPMELAVGTLTEALHVAEMLCRIDGHEPFRFMPLSDDLLAFPF